MALTPFVSPAGAGRSVQKKASDASLGCHRPMSMEALGAKEFFAGLAAGSLRRLRDASPLARGGNRCCRRCHRLPGARHFLHSGFHDLDLLGSGLVSRSQLSTGRQCFACSARSRGSSALLGRLKRLCTVSVAGREFAAIEYQERTKWMVSVRIGKSQDRLAIVGRLRSSQSVQDDV
jgi:hypothetical protein